MDYPSLILFAELGSSLGITVTVLHLLQPALGALLVELCHGKIRADFWSNFTRLMLLIAPLLVVMLFSHSLAESPVSLSRVLRDTLLHALLGQFIALLIVGGILLNFIRWEQHTPPLSNTVEEK